jgi:hypothetical protein
MLLCLRATPRIILIVLTVLLSLVFLLFASASGARTRTKELVWQKVEQANLGRFGLGFGGHDGVEEQSEEEAFKCVPTLSLVVKELMKTGNGSIVEPCNMKVRELAYRRFSKRQNQENRSLYLSLEGVVSDVQGVQLRRAVSKGRGLIPPERPHDAHAQGQIPHGADTLYSPENLHVLIFDWLNTTFPHKENRLINGAQGGVGAGYFGWCFSEWHIFGIGLMSRGTHTRQF